jgi:chromate reductase
MSKTYNVAVLVGSLRKASINRKLALALADLAPASLNLEILEIGDLPLYNEDADGENAPAAYAPFRSKLNAADAVLFITPEYNRSIPGAMKNAIDVGSRPYGKSGFSGKPGAVLSASPGAIGGFGANHHLRQCLVFLDVYVLTSAARVTSSTRTACSATASSRSCRNSSTPTRRGWPSTPADPRRHAVVARDGRP